MKVATDNMRASGMCLHSKENSIEKQKHAAGWVWLTRSSGMDSNLENITLALTPEQMCVLTNRRLAISKTQLNWQGRLRVRRFPVQYGEVTW